MTRIIPFSDDRYVSDYENLEIIIKAIPYEDGFAPVFYISSPSDDYEMNIDELVCLMDGVEMAKRNIDEIISFLISPKRRKDGQE